MLRGAPPNGIRKSRLERICEIWPVKTASITRRRGGRAGARQSADSLACGPGLTNCLRHATVKARPFHGPRKGSRIRNLPSTTLAGERPGWRTIAEMQETLQFFPALSRTEPVRTVCEQMGWHPPDGSRLGFGLRALGELERRGIVGLPPKRGQGRGNGIRLVERACAIDLLDRRIAVGPPFLLGGPPAVVGWARDAGVGAVPTLALAALICRGGCCRHPCSARPTAAASAFRHVG